MTYPMSPNAYKVALIAVVVVVAIAAGISFVLMSDPRRKTVDAWSLYQDEQLGLQFRFPSSWGPVVVALDKSRCADGAPTGKASCQNIGFAFSGIGAPSDALFMVVSGKEYAGGMGDAYVGSLSEGLKDESAVAAVCTRESDPCTTYRTAHGLLVARLSTSLSRYVEGQDDPMRHEIVWHVHVAGKGVVLFSDRVQYQAGQRNSVSILDDVVASIEPLK